MNQVWRWQKLKIKNRRGLSLAGLLYGDPTVTSRIVIISHGFLGTKEGSGNRAVAIAEGLGSLGYGALLFDFSGCGESEGEFKDVSLTNHIADLRAVFDYCRSVGFLTIILIGRSFGGNGAICFAAMEKEVAGVCAWATPVVPLQLFTRLLQTAKRLPGGILELDGERGLHLREGFLADLARHDIKQAAAGISPRPLFILHGDRDELVPVSDAYSLAEAALEPKQLVVVPGGDHQFSGHYKEAQFAIAEWLKLCYPPD